MTSFLTYAVLFAIHWCTEGWLFDFPCRRVGTGDCGGCHSIKGDSCNYCIRNNKCYQGVDLTNPCGDYENIQKKPNCGIGSSYDEYLAFYLWRNSRFVYTAGASAADKTKTCLERDGISEIKQWKVQCSKKHSCRSFIGVDHSKNAILVIFAGSESGQAAEIFGSYWVKNLAEFPPNYANRGAVFEYYFDGFKALWEFNDGDMQAHFNQLRQSYGSYKVMVAGHSLGGALGTLFATYISAASDDWRVPKNQLVFYSFGAPRSGDEKFARSFEALVPTAFRVIHFKDEIPMHPWRGPQAQHGGTEVWYPQDAMRGRGKKICPAEDSRCRNMVSVFDSTLVSLNLDMHRKYFDTWDLNLDTCTLS